MLTSVLGLGAGVLFFIAFIWLLPIIFILKSDKTNGAEKLFWLLAVFFVSWFAWIVYMLLAPLGARDNA